jgi:hypothetical protein
MEFSIEEEFPACILLLPSFFVFSFPSYALGRKNFGAEKLLFFLNERSKGLKREPLFTVYLS